MPKKLTEKPCRVCQTVEKVEDLSHAGLCYWCAKRRMLAAFDAAWGYSHKKGEK